MTSPILEQSCGCTDQHNDLLNFLSDLVDKAINYRDKYFETHKIEEAINKKDKITFLVQETLEIFKEHEKDALQLNKATFNYLKGKLLNIYSNYVPEAEILLSKAIKLNPKLVNAWNELGECYNKVSEIAKAKSCFENAVKEERNKVALRNLSIILRQETTKNYEDQKKYIELSLSYAKEAVQLDTLDGVSWSILGNAYLSYYFIVSQNPSYLKQSLSAYSQAEKYVITRTSSDLHYNKGVSFKYQEEFKLALESFHEASLYDPEWETPQKCETQLLNYLKDIQDLVDTKGKLKPKKLQQILKGIDSKYLGPYGEGGYTASTGQKAKLTEVAYNDLKTGLNEEKVILGKVICSVRNEDTVPFTFCSIDKAGSVIVTTVYNIASGKGVIIGDSVAIPEPYVTDVDFTYSHKIFKFRLIRVETPVIMVVNSKKLPREMQSGVKISISTKFH